MAINRRMAAAMELVNGAPEVSAKTGGYRVYYQNYHRSELKPENGEQGRWVGTQILSLDSADFEAAKTLAGELQQSGLAANHMSFYVSAELQEATKDRLIPLAVNTLKNKAKLYQQALGGEVLMLKSIQVQGAHRMMAEAAPIMMAKSGVTGDQAAPVVAEPDEQEISLTLEGKFELSPIIIE
jgi:predicted secreted protein